MGTWPRGVTRPSLGPRAGDSRLTHDRSPFRGALAGLGLAGRSEVFSSWSHGAPQPASVPREKGRFWGPSGDRSGKNPGTGEVWGTATGFRAPIWEEMGRGLKSPKTPRNRGGLGEVAAHFLKNGDPSAVVHM